MYNFFILIKYIYKTKLCIKSVPTDDKLKLVREVKQIFTINTCDQHCIKSTRVQNMKVVKIKKYQN